MSRAAPSKKLSGTSRRKRVECSMLPWNALSNSNVFSGAIDKTALWLERVGGLENAKRRMVEIATKSPGRYFVFCDFPHTVVAQIDTPSEISEVR